MMRGGNSVWVSGFVLHRRPYQETSFLVDMFTHELGKIRCVARGMRSAKSDRKSVLQPFQSVTCELSGKGELKSIKSAEINAKGYNLQHTALFCGMYLNELINRCLPANIPCPDLFAQYQRALSHLHASLEINGTLHAAQEAALRVFELSLLNELGFLPDISVDAHSQEALFATMDYVFIAEEGMLLKQWYPHLRAVPGQWVINMLNEEWDPNSLKTAKWITRQALQPLLGNKPLKSRELFVSK
jgi:DNA repair protein RecO (recombination protein O)